MTSVSFPAISDAVIQLSKTLPIKIFGASIAWYGLIIAIGICVAAAYAFTQCNRFGFSRYDVLEYLFFGIPACYIGARLYYVIYTWEYYSQHPIEILYVKSGGLAIYGAVIAGAISIFVFTRVKKLSTLSALDIGAICIIIGQIIGRWGNFVNGEAHGYVTSLPWGMSIDGADPVHPTFLYESLWNIMVLILMHVRSKKQKFHGEVMLWYIVGYGFGRFWIEGLRTDSLYIGSSGIRVSQLLAIVSACIALAVLLYLFLTKRPQRAGVTAKAGSGKGTAGRTSTGKASAGKGTTGRTSSGKSGTHHGKKRK